MIGRILLVVGSVLVSLLVLEIGCRALRGGAELTHWTNIVLEQRRGMASHNIGSRFVYDPLLGYTPRPGFVSADLSYDRHGFRDTPPLSAGAADGPPVLT